MTPAAAAILRFKAAYGRLPGDHDELSLFLAMERAQSVTIQDLPAAPASKPLAMRLPGAAKAVLTGRIKPTKEWLADVERGPKRDQPFAPSVWRNHALAVIERERVKGEPSKRLLSALVRVLEREQEQNGNGFVVVTYWFMARWLLACWPATVQLGIRWLTVHAIICPQPTRVRDGKMIVNGPNAYTLQMPDEVPVDEEAAELVPADDPAALALSVMRRIARAWDYWRPRFGLVARPTGWANTSPLRARRDDDPLPA